MVRTKRSRLLLRASVCSICLGLLALGCVSTAQTTPLQSRDSRGTLDRRDAPLQSILSSNPPTETLGDESDRIQQYLATAGAEELYSQSRSHPIDGLLDDAEAEFQSLLGQRSSNINEAARAYRRRRGRHPPPGFDLWHAYAESNNAIIVEDFWDQIYDDLNAFWAVSPSTLRAQAQILDAVIVVKDGETIESTRTFSEDSAMNIINTIAKYLPDMIIPFNSKHEPRVMDPWEDMKGLLSASQSQRFHLPPPQDTKTSISGWSPVPNEDNATIPEIHWDEGDPYSYARLACPPNSIARQRSQPLSPQQIMESIRRSQRQRSPPDPNLMPFIQPSFVTGYSEATSICNEPAVTYYHDALTDRPTTNISTALVPLFGASKLAQVSNDILLPRSVEEHFPLHRDISWSKKADKVFWRGSAKVSATDPQSQPFLQRHRLVQLTNGTEHAISTSPSSSNGVFTPLWHFTAISRLGPSIQTNLTRWLSTLTDIAFSRQMPPCRMHYDITEPGVQGCLHRNHDSNPYRFKYLPSIDGTSSADTHFRTQLLSNSLPIKATLYREWHDSRLIPWKHFVPMNNRFDDLYRIMEYFIGCPEDVCEGEAVEGHDEQAQHIARAGKEWARKVLRKVDMEIYMLRLLLEWARVTDDERLRLGWVGDLTKVR